jgi:hypothetical protein
MFGVVLALFAAGALGSVVVGALPSDGCAFGPGSFGSPFGAGTPVGPAAEIEFVASGSVGVFATGVLACALGSVTGSYLD